MKWASCMCPQGQSLAIQTCPSRAKQGHWFLSHFCTFKWPRTFTHSRKKRAFRFWGTLFHSENGHLLDRHFCFLRQFADHGELVFEICSLPPWMKPSFTSHDLLCGVLLCEMGIKNRTWTWTWGDGPRLFCGSPVNCCVWVEWHVEGATWQEPAPIGATRKSTKFVPEKLSTPLFLQVRKSNQNLERLFNCVLAKWEQIRMLVYQSNSFQFRVVICYFII